MSRYRIGHRRVLFAPAAVVAAAATNFLTSLLTLDYAHLGKPFCEGCLNVSDVSSLQAMDIAHLGGPFVPGVL